MSDIYYSATNNAFYPLSMKDDYEIANSWPGDAIKISPTLYSRLMEQQSKGKVIVPDDKGKPTAKLPPEKSKAEYIDDAELQKASLMNEASNKIAPLQDAVKYGMATDTESALLVEWEKYRVLLYRIDTSKAPNIGWPLLPTSQ